MGIYRRSLAPDRVPLRRKPCFVSFPGLVLLAAGLLCSDPAVAAPAPDSLYEKALAEYQQDDYRSALGRLDEAQRLHPGKKLGADIANLRGAIDLRLHKFDRAQASFVEANKLDSHLWEAQFNAAEVAFRRRDYDESSKQFHALLALTSRSAQGGKRELVEYKFLLSSLLAGHPDAAAGYVQEHDKDSQPPLVYYYLRAAIENRRGHSAEGMHWLADARSVYPVTAAHLYAESFRSLGWETPRASSLMAGTSEKRAAAADLGAEAEARKPTTVAVVQLMGKSSPPPSDTKRRTASAGQPALGVETRAATNSASARIGEGNMPPPVDVAEAFDSNPGAPRGLLALAKPASGGRKGHAASPSATPTGSSSPSPAESASPAGTPDAAVLGGDLPAANATPAPSPEPGFIQAYEAAYVQFLQEKYDEARELLDKADAVQPGQPSSMSLRSQIFKHFYSEGYLQYASKNYDGAVKQLDAADKVLPNQADSFNMRGLIFSRQKNYQDAEVMFKKAIALDGTFWEARFNQAELPFIRSNYTEARARFEALLSQTDPAKQPKETELTEFKVFLTLLLEGKEPAARSLMERFNFSGTTPARYYCQAALDFYHGDQDKALGWVSSARKEYPAKLEGIFAQAFYRVGWFSDSSAAAIARATPPENAAPAGIGAPGGSVTPTVVAVVTPAPTPSSMAVAAVPTPTPVLATPVVAAATPAVAATASATPIIVAMASPPKVQPDIPTPRRHASTPLPSPDSPVPAASVPATAANTTPGPLNTPASTPEIAVPLARDLLKVPTPGASATAFAPTPSVKASPANASPARDLLKVPTPVPTVAAASPAMSATPAASAVPQSKSAEHDEGTSVGDILAIGFVVLAMGMTLVNGVVFLMLIKKKKERLAKKPLRYSGNKTAKPQEAEIS